MILTKPFSIRGQSIFSGQFIDHNVQADLHQQGHDVLGRHYYLYEQSPVLHASGAPEPVAQTPNATIAPTVGIPVGLDNVSVPIVVAK